MNRIQGPKVGAGKAPKVKAQATTSFQLNSRQGTKRASPANNDGLATKDGHIRRLSQNQNSINMYLEQESKFDSTKDASELGGPGGPGTASFVKDYSSSLPDSHKVRGPPQDRSYDEAWHVDQASSNSCQHGEGSCD